MKLSNVIELLEKRTPSSFAMDWDNVGLLLGRKDKDVKRVMVVLDVTRQIVGEAISNDIDLIVSHHPILFSSIKQINDDHFVSEKIISLLEHGISCYAMHTNYDVCQMADLAAFYLGSKEREPLEVTYIKDDKKMGIGFVSELEEKTTLKTYAEYVKKVFELPEVMIFGSTNQQIQKIAVSPGSGRHMIEEALEAGADVLITGDMGHHEGLDAMDAGLAIIEAGHYGLEKIFIRDVSDYLENELKNCVVMPVYSGNPYQVI